MKGEEHLSVEIFENNRDGRKLPKLRLAYTKTDWGVYHVKEDVWSSGSIRDEYSRNIWESSSRNRDSETFMKPEHQDLIWNWCGETYLNRQWHSWTDRLVTLQDDIKHQRWKRRMDNRKQRLDERIANTPALPEDLNEWIDGHLYKGISFLYYKRNGRYADVCCSKCGGKTTVATKPRETFEGQFEKIIETPKNGHHGKCPMCGAYGEWKAQGKTKGSWGMKRNFFIGQSYKGTGAVIRYIQAEKIFQLEEATEGSSLEMTGAKESYIITEIARKYIKSGEKPQTDYQKWSGYSGKYFWDDCNESYGGASIKPGMIYEKTFELLKGTELQYSAAEVFWRKNREFNLFDYMERYTQYPQIEMFTKMGLFGIVQRMMDSHCGLIKNQYASKPEEFLGIRKEHLKLLIKRQGDPDYLDVLEKEKSLNQYWDNRAMEFVKESGASLGNLQTALTYMSMTQLVNRVEKYSGVRITGDEELPMCGRAAGVMKTITGMYFDYLNMRVERGYDLSNTVFLFPRDLQRAHDNMVEETNKAKGEKREQEANDKYPNIKKLYRGLRNQYFYEDEEFLIRPARAAAEIVREGRTLHHCVGGDSYLRGHDKGESIILFLREKNMPELPYITVEIKGTDIRQWYGAYDKKPDKKNMQKWLDAYVKHLKFQEKLQRKPMSQMLQSAV